jgi:hypothetical protein
LLFLLLVAGWAQQSQTRKEKQAMWIIKQTATGKYVAKPGSKESFTRNIKRAVKYATLEAAKANCCGDERCARLESEVE